MALIADRVRKLLGYDPDLGVFRWRVRPSNRVRVGSVAGSLDTKGYRQIRIDGRKYAAHRLAWLYVHGAWPDAQIDHINESKDDNRIVNLRLATNGENQQNTCRAQRNSRSGRRGVHPRNGGWIAQINVDGQRHHLGTFGSSDEAEMAYIEAKRQLHVAWSEGSPG